ncbi:phage tail tape measure protein, TP901 family, core region [Lactobacillus bombicola]|uniref:Phage tail tape measure protein, TP901 family, core region n=1 Tax=Lactobacillus bombicola TaxID=1505723 RepID=A0A1I1TU25_9LACO|nr:phage tail tape measure protein [Lactobacillus bombicola]SFD60738.1 phage tail tape measure protein, TP901 family, core region [Lactobacillus bombicola]
MAGAVRQEGFNLHAKVDYSEIVKANDETNKFVAKMREANQLLHNLKSPNNLDSGFRKAREAANAAADSLHKYESASKAAGSQVASSMHEAQNAIIGLDGKILSTGKSADKLKNKTESAGNDAKKAGEKSSFILDKLAAKLNINTNDIKKMNNEVSNSSGHFGKVKSVLGKVAITAGTVTAAVSGIALAFDQAAKGGSALQSTYLGLDAMLEANGQSKKSAAFDVNRIKASSEATSNKYGIDQNTIGSQAVELSKRGYNGSAILGSNTIYAKAAVAAKETGQTLEESYRDAIDAGTSVMEAYGLTQKAGNSAAKMARYTKSTMNKLTYVANETVSSLSSLTEANSYFASTAKSNNQSMDTALALEGTLSQAHIEGSRAGTNLVGITSVLNNPTTDRQQNALARLGYTYTKRVKLSHGEIKRDKKGNIQYTNDFAGNFVDKKTGKMKQLTDIFADFQKRAKARHLSSSETNQIYSNLFGRQNSNAAIVLAKHGSEAQKLAKNTADPSQTSKAVDSMAKKKSESYDNQIARFKNIWKNTSQDLVMKVLPNATKFLQSVNSFMESSSKALSHVPKPIQNITGVVGGLVGMQAATNLLGKGSNFLLGTHFKGGIVGRIGKKLIGSFSENEDGKRIFNKGYIPKLSGWLFGSKTKNEAGKVVKTKGAIPRAYNATKNGFKWTGRKIGSGASKAWSGTKTGAGKAADGIKRGAKSATTYIKTKAWPEIKGIVSNNNLFGQNTSGRLTGMLQSTKSADGFDNLTTAGKVATGAATVGVAADAGLSIYKGIKAKAGSKERYQNIGAGIGSGIGGGIGLYFGGPLGAALGSQLGKLAGKWGGQAVHSFKNGWNDKKPPKKFWSIENLGWSTHDTVKKVSDGAKLAMGSFKKGWDAKKPPKKIFSLQYLGWATKHGGWPAIIGDAAGRAAKSVQTGWNANKPPKNFWSLENLGYSAHNMWSGFKSSVEGVIKWFKDKWQGLESWFNKTQQNFSNFGHSIDFTDKNSNVRKGIGSFFGAHALGSRGGASHYALVGEAGPELGYRINGSSARLLGANGPEVVKVHSGENILPAAHTAKVLNGGLGFGTVLPGYANGKGTVTKSIATTSKNATNLLSTLSKKNKSIWQAISSDTTSQTTKTQKAAVKSYKTMKNGVNSTMTAMKNCVVDLAEDTSKGFGKALGKMDNYAHSAMKNTIVQLNNGIGGIDKTLSQFGGNTSVINPIKFASGSNGRLDHDQWAVINDASTGPRQEAVVRDNKLYIPRGDNRIIHAQAGDEILNGSQLQELTTMQGLPHFAQGSGVSYSRLREIAKNGASNPSKSFSDNFTSHVKEQAPDLQKGTTALAKNSSTKYGVPWMQAIWNVIKDKFSAGKGGTREQFLDYAEEHYSGKPYQMGATGSSDYDCSGMISSALAHFGVNIGRTTVAMQNSSGVQYLGKDLSKTTAGDIVIFGHGTGAAGHVGIIKNPVTGSMFNETPPRARVTSIADDKGMGYGYYRVKGLHNAATKHADSRLEKLAKRELGSKALSWISKNLGEDSLLGSFAIGGDVADRARALAKAFKSADPSATKTGIAAIIGNWSFESGLNPDITNSIGATGLGQWLGGRAANLKKYAKKHGQSWKSAAAQLNFALHGDGSDSSTLRGILEGKGSVSSLAAKFSSEWERGGYTAQHVAGAQNVAKILGYANGGDPAVGKVVKVGEHGPEYAQFKEPVHVYSNSESKQFDEPKLIKPKQQAQAPVININFNAPIYAADKAGIKAMMKKAAEEAVNAMIEKIADEFGLDLSVF